MRTLVYLLTLPCFSILFAGDALGQPKDIPMLPDVAVAAPSADVPKELAAFSGKWFGYYNGVNTGAYMSDALIVVEKIVSAREIQVFYAGVGRFRTNHGQPWSYRVNATFADGVLEFKAGQTTVVTAKMSGDAALSVTTTSARGSSRGTFKRLAQ